MDKEPWHRLVQGKPLVGLGLALKDGRVDLRGLLAPEPSVARTFRTPGADVAVLEGTTEVRGAVWKALDLSGSRLNGVRFFDCIIENCVFDGCSCKDWRLWSTKVSDSTFRSADLRESALGGVQDSRRNTFRKIDFTGTDLRQTAYVSAEFVECSFKNARLDKVDFHGSTFADCRFEGELHEVLFYRTGFRGDAFPPNEMIGVDFSCAELRWVEFRGLNLESVRFPQDDNHIILDDYPAALDRLLGALKGREDLASRKMVAVFANDRKWAGRRGILNKNDLLEIGGEDALNSVLTILGSGPHIV